MVVHLPCTKCGASLSIVEGLMVQCFNCGTKNVYFDSISLFKDYLIEVLNLTSVDDVIEPDDTEIERRKTTIESFFHDLNSDFYGYNKLIISKLDDIEISPDILLKTIRNAGNLKIIVEEYMLPHLKDGVSKNLFQEIRDLSHIFNKSLLGMYFCYLARERFQLEDCSKYYQFAERNYQNVVDFCSSIKIENPSIDINRMRTIYSKIIEFVIILRDVLTENPTRSSQKLEDLITDIEKIEEKNIQVLNLQTQIEEIYHLGRDSSLLLEEIRVADIFSIINPLEENLLYNAEENIEKFDRLKNWIEETANKYQDYQKRLLKLHSGSFISYLEIYRTDFNKRKIKNTESYDDLLNQVLNKAMGDYNLETIELLDILNDFIQKEKNKLSKEILILRFEVEHDDISKLDEVLKSFIITLFKKSISKDFESKYYTNLVHLIADRHAQFDNYILKFINFLLKEFEDIRNEKTLTLEEQRNLYILELRPNVTRLIEASFTLKDEMIPYPLFLEIIMLSKTLLVDHPEAITLLVENPSTSEIKNVNISFFIPKSFQSRLRFAQLKRIKPLDLRKIETEITPTEKGIYHFMVMIEYTHTGESFWMPSIRLELEVDEDIL